MKVSKSIRTIHDDLSEISIQIENNVKETLATFCDNNRFNFAGRSKELVSFAQKIEAGYYNKDEIDDFYACEIVVPKQTDISSVKRFVIDNFYYISERPDKARQPSDFSFDGLRMYVRLPRSISVDKKTAITSMTFEIQILTMLEKAWGKATHDFTYKCKEVSWGSERLVYQMKALLAHADFILADVENLSSNPALQKNYDKYNDINAISNWVEGLWGQTNCPDNMKRLSETIYNLTKHYNIKLEEIEALVKKHQEFNGALPTNLSIYGTIIQVILDSPPKKFLIKAKEKYKRFNDSKLIIPDEIRIDKSTVEKIHHTRYVTMNKISDKLVKI